MAGVRFDTPENASQEDESLNNSVSTFEEFPDATKPTDEIIGYIRSNFEKEKQYIQSCHNFFVKQTPKHRRKSLDKSMEWVRGEEMSLDAAAMEQVEKIDQKQAKKIVESICQGSGILHKDISWKLRSVLKSSISPAEI